MRKVKRNEKYKEVRLSVNIKIEATTAIGQFKCTKKQIGQSRPAPMEITRSPEG